MFFLFSSPILFLFPLVEWSTMKYLLIFILIFSFGESLNKFLKHYEPLNYETTDLHRVARSTEERIRLNFHAYGRDFKLLLHRVEEKDSVFMKDATVEYANETIPIERKSNIFRGIVEDEENSRVFGSIRRGIFEGVIHMSNGEEFWIESSYPYNSTSSFHSFIYSANDIKMPKPAKRTKKQDYSTFHRDRHFSYPGNSRGTYQGRDPFGRQDFPHYDNRYGNNNPFDRHNSPPNRYAESLRGRRTITEHPFRLCQAEVQPNETPNPSQQESPDWSENLIYNNRICAMSITIDHTLYEYVFNGDGRGDHAETHSELTRIIQLQLDRVNAIYEPISFGGIQGIKFKVGGLTVWRDVNDIGNPFVKETSDHREFLNWHAAQNHDKHCLSYVFTFRDFDESTQGLAYACYLCTTRKATEADQSYNTGMISFRSNGNEVPEKIRHLTLAHELGHSLGSNHDQQFLASGKRESEEYPDCYTDGEMGHFIMHEYANTGNSPNNHLFSPCSIRNITRNLKRLLAIEPGTLDEMQTNCLIESDTPICGNNIIEGDEECDCGFNEHECEEIARDKCCWPANDPYKPCKLKHSDYQCAPSQGKCCNEHCKFKGTSAVCEGDKDCSSKTQCLAASAVCPTPVPAREGLPCNDVTGVCINGDCSGNICTAEGLESCEPTNATCIRYCNVEGKCTSTEDIDQFSQQTYRQKGRWGHKGLLKKANEICKNGGYCDDIGVCRDVLTKEALAKSKVDHGFHTFGEMLAEKWWILIIVIVVCIAILVLCILLCYYKLPKLSLRSPRETKAIPIEVKAEVTAVELKATDFKAKTATPGPSKVTATDAPSTLTGQWIIPERKAKKGGK